MRVRRAQEVRMQRAWDRHVVEKTAAPGEEAPVFLAQKRTADDRVVVHAGPALRPRAAWATTGFTRHRRGGARRSPCRTGAAAPAPESTTLR